MNKRMLKKAIIGAIVGTVLGKAVTGFAMYLKAGVFKLCMPEFVEMVDGFIPAVIIQSILSALFWVICFISTAVYDREDWSLAQAASTHFSIIFVSYTVIGFILKWITPNFKEIITIFIFFAIVYFLIWLIMFLIYRNDAKELTKAAKEYNEHKKKGDNE